MTILITRPEQHAYKSQNALKDAGFESIISPAITLEPTDDAIEFLTHNALTFDALIITSPYALELVLEHVIDKTIQLCVTGNILAERAIVAGFEHVICGRGNAESLLKMIVSKAKRGTTCCFLHGNVITLDLASALKRAGFYSEKKQIYASLPATTFNVEARDALKNGKVTHCLFYSTYTAECFMQLVQSYALVPYLNTIDAVCISREIAEALNETEWQNIHVSPSAQIHDIIGLLRS